MTTADYWIDLLQLTRHPEGGYYREVYRSDEITAAEALPERFGSPRTYSTSIYFLLKAGEPSKFHRLQSDELWHFYAGSAVTVHLIDERGEHQRKVLGPDYTNGQTFVQIIPRHNWFGAVVETAVVDTAVVDTAVVDTAVVDTAVVDTAVTAESNGFVLLGCTVAPGFEFQDFELARREDLLAQFPQYATIIHELT